MNAIQQFFVVLLGIALLAYVIVVIMGTLQGSSIFSNTSSTGYIQSNNILANVSSGITSFFSAINPVYAILAVLVIILVLVVLVRVVQAPAGSNAGTQL